MFILLIINIANSYSQKRDYLNKEIVLFFPSTQTDVMKGFTNNWYSNQLTSMKEPVIFNKLGVFIFRYTNLGIKPYTIRIELKKEKVLLDYKKTNGDGSYAVVGKIIKKKHKVLPISVWYDLLEKVDSCKFWTMSSFKNSITMKDGSYSFNLIMDGTEWVLEGNCSDNYHFVSRNTPENHGDERFAALCNYMESLIEK